MGLHFSSDYAGQFELEEKGKTQGKEQLRATKRAIKVEGPRYGKRKTERLTPQAAMLSQRGDLDLVHKSEGRGHAAGFISLGCFCPARWSMFGSLRLGCLWFSAGGGLPLTARRFFFLLLKGSREFI